MTADPRQVYELFFNTGEVTEIRAFGAEGRSKAWDGFARSDNGVFGYFDNAEDFGRAARDLDKAGVDGTYFVPNLVKPVLINRRKNKLGAVSKKVPATSNHDVRVLRWLLVDFDAVRPAGISATEAELSAAMETAKAAKALLAEMGFAEPIKGLSGNGYHLNYRLPDTELDEAAIKAGKCPYTSTGGLLARALAALHQAVGNPACKIDVVNHNAARIWKLYGTWARKGENTEETPHRQSFLFADAPRALADVPVTPWAAVERLAESGIAAGSRSHQDKDKPAAAAGVPAKITPPAGRAERMPGPKLGKLQVEEYLAAHGRELHSVSEKGGTTWFHLRECVFNEQHKAKDAAILQTAEGKLLYHCSHDSCKGKTFSDAKHIVSGQKSLKEWMEGYDPNWKPPVESCGSGIVRGIEVAPVHVQTGAADLPSPVAIDPMEFFEVRGTRPVFVVQAMANYLAAYLAPIVCTDSQFWRYADGCWKRFHEDTIRQMVAQALKDKVQADWIKGSIQVLAALTNRLEADWMRRPYVICLKNGVIDLEPIMRDPAAAIDPDALLRPHDPAYGCRAQLPVEYDPDAGYDRWIKALWEIFPEGRECSDEGKQDCEGDDKLTVLQQFCGYLLLPTCKYERCAFMVGAGANGKSTLINTIIGVLGKANTVEMGLDDLARSFNIPYLQDKLLVTCTEMSTREPSAVGILKKCISGDMVSGEWKYKQRIDFYPTAKFVFALNEVPGIVDKSYGFARKILVVDFKQRFEDERKDVDLPAKLGEERNGIFLWMLQGAIELIRQKGFSETESVKAAKVEFLEGMNPFLLFIKECVDQAPELRCPAEPLYERYQTWAGKSGLQALGKIKFYHSLASHLPAVKKMRLPDRRQGFAGIGIRPDVVVI